MLKSLLKLDENRVLVEQLRLLLGNVGMSVIPTIILVAVLLASFFNPTHGWALVVWAVAVLASKLGNAWHARQRLARGISAEEAPRLARSLQWQNALDGLAWGGLPWATLDHTGVAGTVLVVAIMAGVTSNAMSVLSPVLPVFLAFCLCAVAAMALKLALMSDPAFHTLAYITLLYIATHVAQGRTISLAARSAINLRFENLELIARLREETERAQAAHQAAELANLAKSKFLAAASHDLRQPAHALGLFLEVIGRGELSAVQRDMLGNARVATAASSEMLNTLLDFSRIEAGVIQPCPQVFRLQKLLDKLEAEMAPQAVAKGLVFRSRETPALVCSDPALVELVLRNLVSNAIRYSESGGVLLGCRRRGQELLCQVWDTGLGIEASQHQAIFREFHQLGNPERDRNKGLGLGLAIVDGLVRTLGLRLGLASRPGRGSVFWLVLPLATQPLGDTDSTGPAAASPASPLSPLHVLVIDDDEAVRLGMARLLHDWGCSCVAVESVEQGLAAGRARRPDLVISDYRLREQRTGTQAIAALRAELGTNPAAPGTELPALLITGDTAPERLREAQASGVPLLHKPVAPGQLHAALLALIQRSRPG